jgi:hypothetical protein
MWYMLPREGDRWSDSLSGFHASHVVDTDELEGAGRQL